MVGIGGERDGRCWRNRVQHRRGGSSGRDIADQVGKRGGDSEGGTFSRLGHSGVVMAGSNIGGRQYMGLRRYAIGDGEGFANLGTGRQADAHRVCGAAALLCRVDHAVVVAVSDQGHCGRRCDGIKHRRGDGGSRTAAHQIGEGGRNGECCAFCGFAYRGVVMSDRDVGIGQDMGLCCRAIGDGQRFAHFGHCRQTDAHCLARGTALFRGIDHAILVAIGQDRDRWRRRGGVKAVVGAAQGRGRGDCDGRGVSAKGCRVQHLGNAVQSHKAVAAAGIAPGQTGCGGFQFL